MSIESRPLFFIGELLIYKQDDYGIKLCFKNYIQKAFSFLIGELASAHQANAEASQRLVCPGSVMEDGDASYPIFQFRYVAERAQTILMKGNNRVERKHRRRRLPLCVYGLTGRQCAAALSYPTY